MTTLVVSGNAAFAEEAGRAVADREYEIKRLNERFTLEIEWVKSAEEAIDLVNSREIDLLLVDPDLPGISGLKMLECLDPVEHDLNIVMILSGESVKDAVAAIKLGAFDVIARPYSAEELQDAVRKAGRNLILTRKVKKLQSEKNLIRHEFFSLLSHELKAPLNAIQGYLAILRDRFVEIYITDWDMMVDRCLGRVQQMKKMTDDMLQMTLIESGQKVGGAVEFDLAEKVRESIETVTYDAGKRDIAITFDADEPLNMEGDPADAALILNNLLSNAVKYNRDGGSVEVDAGARDGNVFVSVRDTGIGMTPEERSQIFRDFVRIKNKDTYRVIGTGLGLSLVKKIVDLHGGAISVESEQGKGSTFTVTLPRKKEVGNDSPQQRTKECMAQ